MDADMCGCVNPLQIVTSWLQPVTKSKEFDLILVTKSISLPKCPAELLNFIYQLDAARSCQGSLDN